MGLIKRLSVKRTNWHINIIVGLFLLITSGIYFLPHLIFTKNANAIEKRVGITGCDWEELYLIYLTELTHHKRLKGNPFLAEHTDNGTTLVSPLGIAPYFPLSVFASQNAYALGRLGDAIYPPLILLLAIVCLRSVGLRWMLVFPMVAVLMFGQGFVPPILKVILQNGFYALDLHAAPAFEGYDPSHFKAFLTFSRPISPQTNALAFFVFLICLVFLLFTEKPRRNVLLPIVGGAFLGILIHQYYFFWVYGGVVLGILIIFSLFFARQLTTAFLTMGTCAIIVGLPVFLQQWETTPAQIDLRTRMGFCSMHNYVLPPKSWWIISLFGCVISVFRKTRPAKNHLLLAFAFLLAAPVVLNQQLITGRGIQVMHFVYLPISFGNWLSLAILITNCAKSRPGQNKMLRYTITTIILLFTTNGIYVQTKDYLRVANTSRFRAKVAEKALKANELISSNKDIAMPFLAWEVSAPLSGKPVFHSYGAVHSLVTTEELHQRAIIHGWLYGYDLGIGDASIGQLIGSIWHLTPLSQRLDGAKEQLLENIARVNAEKIGSIRQRYSLDAVLYPPGMECASRRLLNVLHGSYVIDLEDGWQLAMLPDANHQHKQER